MQPNMKKKLISKMAVLTKNGIRLVAFFTEVDFRMDLISIYFVITASFL